MKYRQTVLVILAALSTSLVLADDINTINGKEYKDATVTRVEPDGIVPDGIGARIYECALPSPLRERILQISGSRAEFLHSR